MNELGLGRTAKAQNGDQKAWNVLFRKYNRVLLRLAFLILGSLDQARDVVQETFIKLNQIKPKHFEGKIKSYLMVIAHRLALKEKNRLKPFTKISEEHLPQNTDLFIDDQIKAETQHQIYKTISELSDEHRDILILKFYGELSYEEISKTLNIPMGTVKSRIFYAVKICKNKLQEKRIL